MPQPEEAQKVQTSWHFIQPMREHEMKTQKMSRLNAFGVSLHIVEIYKSERGMDFISIFSINYIHHPEALARIVLSIGTPSQGGRAP